MELDFLIKSAVVVGELPSVSSASFLLAAFHDHADKEHKSECPEKGFQDNSTDAPVTMLVLPPAAVLATFSIALVFVFIVCSLVVSGVSGSVIPIMLVMLVFFRLELISIGIEDFSAQDRLTFLSVRVEFFFSEGFDHDQRLIFDWTVDRDVIDSVDDGLFHLGLFLNNATCDIEFFLDEDGLGVDGSGLETLGALEVSHNGFLAKFDLAVAGQSESGYR